jgi:DNA-binding MarR family transcriptional regulator
MASDDDVAAQRSSALEAETMQLAESLRDVVGRFVRSVREHSGTCSSAQTETLAHIERSGPVSIATLAVSRGVTHQTMRVIVMKLVEAGLLTLVLDVGDARAYLVHLTRRGKAQLRKEKSARTRWLTAKLLDETSMDERQSIAEAIKVLDIIAKASVGE